MTKKILKFGGTSVGSIERIQHVANIIKKEYDSGNQIIAVVSAMAGKTNELIQLSKDISKDFNKREFDVLLSSGEQITCALLAGALINLNVKARSWLNWQIPILTDGEHSNARIINMNTGKINEFLKEGIAIIPGFQGISQSGDITTNTPWVRCVDVDSDVDGGCFLKNDGGTASGNTGPSQSARGGSGYYYIYVETTNGGGLDNGANRYAFLVSNLISLNSSGP